MSLVQPLAQTGVQAELRLGCLGLCPFGLTKYKQIALPLQWLKQVNIGFDESSAVRASNYKPEGMLLSHKHDTSDTLNEHLLTNCPRNRPMQSEEKATTKPKFILHST